MRIRASRSRASRSRHLAITSRRCAMVALAALLFVDASSAVAGGYSFPDLGTVALSRGGAFVARADDPTALYYNPAGVTRLRGTHILVNANVLNQNISFTRRQYGDLSIPPENFSNKQSDHRMPTVENSAGPSIAPFLAITSDLGFLHRINMVLMAGIYGPNAAPRRTFPAYCEPGSDPCVPTDANGLAAPNRYDTLGVDVLVVQPTIGLAWQPLSWLSIGAVAMFNYADFHYETVITAFASENPKADVGVTIDADSGIVPSGLFGIHVAPFRFLEAGASLRLGYTYKTNGTLCAGVRKDDGTCDLPDNVKEMLGGADIRTQPNPVTAGLEIPETWVVRTGVRYINHDGGGRERFDIELDFVWESGELQGFTTTMSEPIDVLLTDGNVFKSIEDVTLPHNWQSIWGLRLGGSYRLYDLFKGGVLVFRAGGMFESAAMQDAYTRLNFMPMQRMGFALGIGARWGRYQLDIGYARIFHPTRDVDPPDGQQGCSTSVKEDCGSQIKQLAPLTPRGQSKDIGNGTYKQSIDQLTFGLRVVFGQ